MTLDMRFKVFRSKLSTLDEAVGLAVELEAFKHTKNTDLEVAGERI